jgi:hypothetical protein
MCKNHNRNVWPSLHERRTEDTIESRGNRQSCSCATTIHESDENSDAMRDERRGGSRRRRRRRCDKMTMTIHHTNNKANNNQLVLQTTEYL